MRWLRIASNCEFWFFYRSALGFCVVLKMYYFLVMGLRVLVLDSDIVDFTSLKPRLRILGKDNLRCSETHLSSYVAYRSLQYVNLFSRHLGPSVPITCIPLCFGHSGATPALPFGSCLNRTFI